MCVSITNSIRHFCSKNFAGGRQGAKLIPTPNTRSVNTVRMLNRWVVKCTYLIFCPGYSRVAWDFTISSKIWFLTNCTPHNPVPAVDIKLSGELYCAAVFTGVAWWWMQHWAVFTLKGKRPAQGRAWLLDSFSWGSCIS